MKKKWLHSMKRIQIAAKKKNKPRKIIIKRKRPKHPKLIKKRIIRKRAIAESVTTAKNGIKKNTIKTSAAGSKR